MILTKKEQDSIADHFSNFLDAIRSGKDETLNCDIAEGFIHVHFPTWQIFPYRWTWTEIHGGLLKSLQTILKPTRS